MRNIALVVLALLIAGTVSSQGRFGVRAGAVFNYINTDGSNAPDFSSLKSGFTFAMSYELPASKNFVVQPELGYVRLNADEGLTNSTLKLDYVVIPLVLKLVTNNQNFSVYGGPQLGFLTNADNKTPTGENGVRESMTQTDFSVLGGIEYITPINVTINARYVHGLSNVQKVEYQAYTTRHQYLSLTIGYLFARKKQ